MGRPLGSKNKEKPWTDALRIVLSREGEDGRKRLFAIAEQCAAAAEGGDMQAIKEIGDRLDGKPAQAIIGGDEDDPAIRTVTRIELVAARDDSAD